MIKFVICEDSDEALETAGKYVIKAMMNYDIEYKVLKFKEYNNNTYYLYKNIYSGHRITYNKWVRNSLGNKRI